MITLKEYTIFSLVFISTSFCISFVALFYIVKVYKQQDEKIMLLFSALVIGIIINMIGPFMGLLQLFIFPDQTIPNWYCNSETFIDIFGLLLFTLYQIAVDYILYLNIFNYQVYEDFLENKIKKFLIYSYSITFLPIILLSIFDSCEIQPPLTKINCWLKPGPFNSILNYILGDILPIIGLTVDIMVMVKIIKFYKTYSLQECEKSKLKIFLMFPFVYGFFAISQFLVSQFQFQNQESVVLQGLSLFFIQIRGGIVSGLIIMLIYSSKNVEGQVSFTLQALNKSTLVLEQQMSALSYSLQNK